MKWYERIPGREYRFAFNLLGTQRDTLISAHLIHPRRPDLNVYIHRRKPYRIPTRKLKL